MSTVNDTTVSGFGISVTVPDTWDAQIFKLTSETDDPRGISMPAMHAASVPLSAPQSHFGSDVVMSMGPDDVFIALVEYGPDDASGELFAMNDHIPVSLADDAFSPWSLQVTLPGQVGAQFFLTTSGRAFSLYIVVGSADAVDPSLDTINGVLGSIVVQPN
jgi:hypothetical protein